MLERGMETSPRLHQLTFLAGCNTPAEVTRSQLKINVERDLPWLEQSEPKDKPLVIVGGGASLKDAWFSILSHGGDIMALNNSYAFLMERGIEPDYYMMLDARAENVEFLRNPSTKTKHLIAAQCHPSIFDALADFDTILYLTVMPESLELTAHIDKPKVQIAGTVGTVGMKALCMAHALGYKELHLYGYDSSYADGHHHAFTQVINDNAQTIEVFLDGKSYITTPTMAQQATEFCSFTRGMTQYYGFDINLHCTGLLPDMVVYCNKLGEIPLEIREQEKYEQMWEHDVYRKFAPAESLVEEAMEALNATVGASVIDFGCGTGRGSAKLLEMGYEVTSLDHAANCVDNGIKLNFIKACLWDLPDISADYGICIDVMEHIPTEKVQDVLSGISKCTKAAYFNIATRDDCLGSKIGKKLHMTVMEATHWQALMKIYWEDVVMLGKDGEATFIVRNNSV